MKGKKEPSQNSGDSYDDENEDLMQDMLAEEYGESEIEELMKRKALMEEEMGESEMNEMIDKFSEDRSSKSESMSE